MRRVDISLPYIFALRDRATTLVGDLVEGPPTHANLAACAARVWRTIVMLRMHVRVGIRRVVDVETRIASLVANPMTTCWHELWCCCTTFAATEHSSARFWLSHERQ